MKNFLNRFVLRSKQISGYLIHGMAREVFKFKNTGETVATSSDEMMVLVLSRF